MNKKVKKDLRIMLTINFIVEIIGIITLYLSSIHSMKTLNTNILSYIFVIANILCLFLIFKLSKNKINKYLIIASFGLEILVIIFTFFFKNAVLYIQVVSDILKFLVISNIYKELKKTKKVKRKKYIISSISLYVIAKIFCIVLCLSKGLMVRPIITTLSIIGIVLPYTLYIKSLEKK